jgi:hypothetical protein
MTTMDTLRRWLGNAHVQQWIQAEVHDRVLQDCLPPDTALRLLEQGLAEHDPLVIATPGQIWYRRDDADPALPDSLFLCGRYGDPLRVAYQDGIREEPQELPLLTLRQYRLDHWVWTTEGL